MKFIWICMGIYNKIIGKMEYNKINTKIVVETSIHKAAAWHVSNEPRWV